VHREQNFRSQKGRFLIFLSVVGFLFTGVGSFACAADSAVSSPVNILTPDEKLGIVWNHFLKVMSSGNDSAIHAECTESGFLALLALLNPHEPHADQWKRWSEAWSKWGQIRWESITTMVAYGKLGPKNKSASINFALTPQGWKLDYLSPAE
jgi:hypothetical protein